MRLGANGSLVDDLGQLFRNGVAPSRDGTLVERYAADGDGTAFEALVVRHGPMVLSVCQRILANSHDAEDIFQAAFVLLARKAARLRDPDRVGPWLHGVASRMARKARSRGLRHRRLPLEDGPARESETSEWSDVRPILDAELGRLPRAQREVLVLCLLEGATADEASDRLGCPVGTVKSRLARGRLALRDRLVRRGIAPALALAAASAEEASASVVPPSLIRTVLGVVASSATATGTSLPIPGAIWIMSSRSTTTYSLIVGGLAVAGVMAATWMSNSVAQVPGNARNETQAAKEVPSGEQKTQQRNLRSIALALNKYYVANNHFPSAASYGSDIVPKLSWRVAILPILEPSQLALYREFHQDEPWDSPHNKALIARMPAVFETPAAPAPAGETRIRGFVGPGAFFEGTQGLKLESFTDGTSNTVMMGIAAEPTPWTKPGELPFLAGNPLPALDESDPAGFPLLMVDGSIRTLPFEKAQMLPFAITRGGGEVLEWPQSKPSADEPTRRHPVKVMVPASATPTPPGPAAGMMSGGAEGGMGAMMGGGEPDRVQALEQRMKRIEDRLDKVMQAIQAKRP
ncbi:sigma-70 family RNA polymerase sigma factor [Aquisphaera insulae]|uniref:sigma-70 family RNA polymerase sigma factor n=1 Tax=Aquisphaera insulae TaxID=2712864 RepID=UPI0013EA8AF2|nr:sigma-70 family RNA polymerase sigma factor [Aquisphaera insulae]